MSAPRVKRRLSPEGADALLAARCTTERAKLALQLACASVVNTDAERVAFDEVLDFIDAVHAAEAGHIDAFNAVVEENKDLRAALEDLRGLYSRAIGQIRDRGQVHRKCP